MALTIRFYGDPVLRQPGERIAAVTAEIRRLAADMLKTMREHRGVGLAAQQIGRALQLTVLDVSEVTDRPSWIECDGVAVQPGEFMPLVLINPEIKPSGAAVEAPEGCLSFPEIYADIRRADAVDVRAVDLEGRALEFRCGGLLSRAIQHECDHLQGILFIDRMSRETKAEIKAEIDALHAETKRALRT